MCVCVKTAHENHENVLVISFTRFLGSHKGNNSAATENQMCKDVLDSIISKKHGNKPKKFLKTVQGPKVGEGLS